MASLSTNITIGIAWHAFIIGPKDSQRFIKFREVDIVSINPHKKIVRVNNIKTDEVVTYHFTKKYLDEYSLAGVLELEMASLYRW